MTARHFIVSFATCLLAVSCTGSKHTTTTDEAKVKPAEPQPTAGDSPDAGTKAPTGSESVGKGFSNHHAGLTSTFSYHGMPWGTKEPLIRHKMGKAKSEDTIGPVKMLAFDTETRGFKTVASFGLLNGEFATLDIVIVNRGQCDTARGQWIKALTIKYGDPAQTTDTYTVWRLADNSRIVVDHSNGSCGIIYAKNPKTRVQVDRHLKTGK